MEQVITKRKFTREEIEQREKEYKEEKARRLAELDAPDLTDEEKEFLVELKIALEEPKNGYPEEEFWEIIFEEIGLCM